MLKPWSFFPCYWLLLSNYVAGTQGIQRAENMSGAIYKWWLFVYSLAWTSENIERGKKIPIKNTSSSQQISACICSFTWNVNVTADKFLFPHLLTVFSGSSEMKVSLKALISPWKLHFSCPQVTVFKNMHFPLFLLTEPSQGLEDSSQNYTNQDWIILKNYYKKKKKNPGLWGLSCLTSNQTCVHCSGSAKT